MTFWSRFIRHGQIEHEVAAPQDVAKCGRSLMLRRNPTSPKFIKWSQLKENEISFELRLDTIRGKTLTTPQ